ncbi:STAS domain-containing protein [Catellatospora bangladeshensis]|uniref:Anti-sigma factor antagonist n=1 Tax=Catellatospora bangladeshensis TaxID=310355 RepID=A0A8J3JPQ1_9ACTN|nr:STAS domain-containing protein [Catellatospora bangladeshensis]GIF84622.1 hypothetical protein Cba03nite_59710 [Catellatospora bangladeshensis]
MSDSLAQVIVAEDRGRPVLRINGEVDMSNVDEVDEQLRSAAADTPSVLLDLTELGFLDSQGLRMIQRLADDNREKGKAMVVIAPESSVVGSLLALTGMDKTVDVRQALPD